MLVNLNDTNPVNSLPGLDIFILITYPFALSCKFNATDPLDLYGQRPRGRTGQHRQETPMVPKRPGTLRDVRSCE